MKRGRSKGADGAGGDADGRWSRPEQMAAESMVRNTPERREAGERKRRKECKRKCEH